MRALFQFLGVMDHFSGSSSPAVPLSRRSDLANMDVYADIYGFGFRTGGRGGYLSTLPSPDVASICEYLPTVMSGIYVTVTAPEPAARLFGIRVEINETDQASVLERGRRVIRARYSRYYLGPT